MKVASGGGNSVVGSGGNIVEAEQWRGIFGAEAVESNHGIAATYFAMVVVEEIHAWKWQAAVAIV